MTLQEFKAWFEGFRENLDGRPNEKQWKRICKRVQDIDDRSVTPVIVERWRDRYVPNWPYPDRIIWSGQSASNSGTIGGPINDQAKWISGGGDVEKARDYMTVLADMGKEEARTLS